MTENDSAPFSALGDTHTLVSPAKPLGRFSEALPGTLERFGEALMRHNEVELAIEAFSMALRVRYVTAEVRDAD